MLRSEAQIVSQSAQLNANFTEKYYEIASRRQRGVKYSDNFNMSVVLLRALNENTTFDTLTTQDINNIIDTLIA